MRLRSGKQLCELTKTLKKVNININGTPLRDTDITGTYEDDMMVCEPTTIQCQANTIKKLLTLFEEEKVLRKKDGRDLKRAFYYIKQLFWYIHKIEQLHGHDNREKSIMASNKFRKVVVCKAIELICDVSKVDSSKGFTIDAVLYFNSDVSPSLTDVLKTFVSNV